MILISILTFLRLFASSTAQNQSNITGDGSPELICDVEANECYVSCIGDSVCHGTTIHCPNTTNCNQCIINCQGLRSCYQSRIYSNDCQNVELNLISGNIVAQYTIIDAPDNNGNLTVNVLDGNWMFRDAVIYAAPNTNSIEVNCYPYTSQPGNNECSSLGINGTTANHVSVTCTGGSDCSFIDILCPYSSSSSGDYEINCIFDCSSVGASPFGGTNKNCEFSRIYTDYGVNMDLKVLCNDTNDEACTGIEVYCNYNKTVNGWNNMCSFERSITTQTWECLQGDSTICARDLNTTSTGQPVTITTQAHATTTGITQTSRDSTHETESTITTATAVTTAVGGIMATLTTMTTTVTQEETKSGILTSTSIAGKANTTENGNNRLSTGSGGLYATYTQLEEFYDVFVPVFIGICSLIGLLGYIDARCIRRNDIFAVSAIIIFTTYTLDFVSDVFFATQIFLTSDINNSNNTIDGLLFFSCVVFIILPLFIGNFQLQHEIGRWLKDSHNKDSINSWLNENLRMLYLLSIISGSSFSAIELCNSNIFQLSKFNMSLTKSQKARFRNKRVFSVVLLENLPQLTIQLIYLLGDDSSNSKDGSVITIFAIIFGILSVVLSLFESFEKSALMSREASILIKFKLESKQIGTMRKLIFRETFVCQRSVITHEFAKILEIDSKIIEELQPIQISNGALMRFYIKTQNINVKSVTEKIKNEYNNGDLKENIGKCFGLKEVPKIVDLEAIQLTSDYDLNVSHTNDTAATIVVSGQIGRSLTDNTIGEDTPKNINGTLNAKLEMLEHAQHVSEDVESSSSQGTEDPEEKMYQDFQSTKSATTTKDTKTKTTTTQTTTRSKTKRTDKRKTKKKDNTAKGDRDIHTGKAMEMATQANSSTESKFHETIPSGSVQI